MRFVLSGFQSPAVRKQLINSIYGVVGDAAEHVPEPYKGIDLNEFAGGNKASQDSRCPPAGIAPEERPVSSSQRHHASILPISGKKLKFTIVGTRFTVGDCGCSTASNAQMAGSSMSRWRRAQ